MCRKVIEINLLPMGAGGWLTKIISSKKEKNSKEKFIKVALHIHFCASVPSRFFYHKIFDSVLYFVYFSFCSNAGTFGS